MFRPRRFCISQLPSRFDDRSVSVSAQEVLYQPRYHPGVCVILYFYTATCGPKGHGSGCYHPGVSTRVLVFRAKGSVSAKLSPPGP